MRAVVARTLDGPAALVVEQRGDLVAGPGEAVIDVRVAALNRRDLGATAGKWPGIEPPFVPGSDCAGVVRSIGAGVSGLAPGDEVVVLPSLDWGDDPAAPGPAFRVLGGPDDGTFAEQVRVPGVNVFRRPRSYSWHEAAALPLAGVTMWRALHTRARLRAGESVLVLGAGAGTSTLAVSMARAAGAQVWVTSSDASKIDRARELGASGGVDYRSDGWVEEIRERTGGVDVVLDGIGTWEQSIGCVRSGGRVVAFGQTAAPRADVTVAALYRSQISLLGTMMGSPAEFRALLRHAAVADWRPVIDSAFALDAVGEACARLAGPDHFGKVVLDVG